MLAYIVVLITILLLQGFGIECSIHNQPEPMIMNEKTQVTEAQVTTDTTNNKSISQSEDVIVSVNPIQISFNASCLEEKNRNQPCLDKQGSTKTMKLFPCCLPGNFSKNITQYFS